MAKQKRVMRPRLEVASTSEIYGQMQEDRRPMRPISIGFNDLAEADLLLKDAKRLHRFLGRAIAFLELEGKRKDARRKAGR